MIEMTCSITLRSLSWLISQCEAIAFLSYPSHLKIGVIREFIPIEPEKRMYMHSYIRPKKYPDVTELRSDRENMSSRNTSDCPPLPSQVFTKLAEASVFLPRNTEHTLVEIHKAKVHLFALSFSGKSLADLTNSDFASHIGQIVRFVVMPIL